MSYPNKPTAEIGLWITWSAKATVDVALSTQHPTGKKIKFVRNNTGGDLVWQDEDGQIWFQPGIGAGEFFIVVNIAKILTSSTACYGEGGTLQTTGNPTDWRILGE